MLFSDLESFVVTVTVSEEHDVGVRAKGETIGLRVLLPFEKNGRKL
jgi:hypothetical protein